MMRVGLIFKVFVFQIIFSVPLLSVSTNDILMDLGFEALIESHRSEDKHLFNFEVHPFRDSFIDGVVSEFYNTKGHFVGTELARKRLVNLVQHAQMLEQNLNFKIAILCCPESKQIVDFFKKVFVENLPKILSLITVEASTEEELKNILEAPFNVFIEINSSSESEEGPIHTN